MSGFWHRFGERYPQIRTVITVMPLVMLLILANNQRQEEQKRRSDAQFRKAQIATDRKFQQALSITTRQFSYSTNKQVCAFRAKTLPELQSYRDAARDPDSSASARERNAGRVLEDERFLRSLVTIPSDFDCATLPKNPPKAVAP